MSLEVGQLSLIIECWLFIQDILMWQRPHNTFIHRVKIAFSGKLPNAKTVLLIGSYSGQIFYRKNLLTRPRK